MNDIVIKYNKLNKNKKQQVNDFLDFLLRRQINDQSKLLSEYKKKILSVSTWSKDDCKIFEKNQQLFNQWKIQEW